jgi:hypothetical protein
VARQVERGVWHIRPSFPQDFHRLEVVEFRGMWILAGLVIVAVLTVGCAVGVIACLVGAWHDWMQRF